MNPPCQNIRAKSTRNRRARVMVWFMLSATLSYEREIRSEKEHAMIKLGVLDFDTSHVVEFTRRLNHVGIKEDQWVDGAKVVIGCPGESKIMPERIPDYTKQMKEFGVPLVDKPEEMIGKVDGMLIESQEGTPHY